MERELDKIARRFKVYSREQEKDQPLETETGKVTGTGTETGSEKTSASEGEEREISGQEKERYHTVQRMKRCSYLPLCVQT